MKRQGHSLQKDRGCQITRSPSRARPPGGYHRGTEALQRRCLHMPRACRPQAWLPHETPIKKP
eukprot:489460-Pyramimonas_sp.AAC.1